MTRRLDFDTPLYPDGLPGHHGGEGEMGAALAVLDGLSAARRRVFDWLREQGDHGGTCREAQAALGLSAQQRLSDLVSISKRRVSAGLEPLVVDSGRKRPSPVGTLGLPCTVYTVHARLRETAQPSPDTHLRPREVSPPFQTRAFGESPRGRA